jgi:TolB-like protein/DNA-binding winged helix-turn-helix (wHTH) protein/Tfp pilus assembly protein PilF
LNNIGPSRAEAFLVAGCEVEPSTLEVNIDGHRVRLEAKVMLVLVYLAEQAGRVVSRAELEENLWPGRIVTEDSATNAIAKLRRVFRDDPRNPRVIETIPKSGYRLIAEVTRPGEAATAAAPVSQLAERSPPSQRPVSGSKWIAAAGLVALVLLGFLVQQGRDETAPLSSVPPATRPVVAVIPFGNLGRIPENDYFANGITADLVTDLSKLNGLLVIARRTTLAYRDQRLAPARIAAELGVDYFVTGTVQRLGQALRINVRLIETRRGHALWGERYSGDLTDLFAIQDRITAAVVAALRVELAPAERERLASRPTASIAAYDAYLRGLEAHGGRSETSNLVARGHFEDAIASDPQFARAYAGLALTHSREAIDGWTPMPGRSLNLANRFADKAAAIDASLPQVHFVSGQILLFERRHNEAVAAAERAIEIDPNYADAFALMAWTLNYAGRPDKAITVLNMAMRLNPQPPASYLEILGEIYFAQRRYQDSASTFESVLDINPAYLRARLWNAAALVGAGAMDLAEWEIVEALVASPQLAISRLAFAFPFRDARTRETALNALRDAGVPDR